MAVQKAFVPGFIAAGTAAGIKKNGAPDLALLVCEAGARGALIATRNVVKGHSLQRSIRVLGAGAPVQALLINSGNANACVGPDGERDAERVAELVAAAIPSARAETVLTASTGVIGFRLPMEAMAAGIEAAAAGLTADESGFEAAAEAIRTTDTHRKLERRTAVIDGCACTLAGMAKGSGMIHPNMATMIAVLLTDLAIAPACLQTMLRRAADRSFNRLSVDGDMSVCDMVVLLASGEAGNPEISDPDSETAAAVQSELDALAIELTRQLARDGEGATKLIEIRVRGAMTDADAVQIASSIARSPLFKTMIYGEDANWGRILTAAGYAGVDFDPDLVTIHIGDLEFCRNGMATDFDEGRALEILQAEEIVVTVDLHAGSCQTRYWTCDFSHDYVSINGSYRS
ncbi:MAG: bifunctional glutamate N-acetyltransferase/amino-acid acetyltransferase ArgJ [Bacillota bacterium]|nr:bifunctional glutamate N-acetyltransferase/amino-acid acetyltransferase ArgJ [Bacillota bacterium]